MKKKIIALLIVVTMVLAGTSTVFAETTDDDNYLTFTAQEAGSTVTFHYASGEVECSVDGETWNKYVGGTQLTLVGAGNFVKFRGDGVTTNVANHFYMTGKIAASGDVTSLTNKEGGDAGLTASCYSCMFYGCESLTTAPELPATTLADNCYASMFYGCTSLTTAPELPATTLAEGCYNLMFSGCTNLTEAPELPAENLADSCYNGMFFDCRGLTTAPELSATTLANSCYRMMFYSCTGLTEAPDLPAEKLAEKCYASMFDGCTSLTEAPDLPAEKLADYCYSGMFLGCSGLTEAPELPATTLANDCYSYMFCGCTALEVSEGSATSNIIIKDCPSTDAEGCVEYMFFETGGSYTDDPKEGNTYYYGDPAQPETTTPGTTASGTEYPVNFDSMGGTEVNGQHHAKGEKLTVPANPTKDGYTFAGWYLDKNYTQAWNFDLYTVSGPTTLYAKWTAAGAGTGGSSTTPNTGDGNTAWPYAVLGILAAAAIAGICFKKRKTD